MLRRSPQPVTNFPRTRKQELEEWSVCGELVVSHRSFSGLWFACGFPVVIGQSSVIQRLVSGQSLFSNRALSWQSVVSQLTVSGQSVVSLWSVNGRSSACNRLFSGQ